MRFITILGLELELEVDNLILARLYLLLTLALLGINIKDELSKLFNIKKPPL